MSKIFKTAILAILLFSLSSVNALTPKVEYIDNVYSNRIIDGKSINGQLGYIYINDSIAFCIDPMKIIGNEYESFSDIWDNYFTKEQQIKLKLIIHYGIGIHENNKYYYMATQELIWRLNHKGEFYFTETNSLDGKKIDIELYKNEILEKVRKHDIYPSFNKSTYTTKLYNKLYLMDSNNVIDDYVYLSGGIVYKKINALEVLVNNPNPTTIKLVKTTKSGKSSNIYIGNGQTLITSNIDERKEAQFNIIPKVSPYLDIIFKEKDNLINDKIKFKIYDHGKSNYIYNGKIFESNSGEFNSDFTIDPGTYEIEYVEIPNNYIFSKLPNKFTIDENNNKERYAFVSYLEKPYGILKINRSAINFDGMEYKLDNMNYKIYANDDIYDNTKILYKKDQLITNITTKKGYVEYILPLGNYRLEEDCNKYNICKHNVENISFQYVDPTIEIYPVAINIVTPLPEINLNITTYKENIDMTYNKYEYFKYNLFASEDIYYLGNLIYKKNELVYSLKSDVYGNISEKLNIAPGKYELKEATDNNIYYYNDSILIDYIDKCTSINKYDYKVYKNLKRGNLLIKVYSEVDEIPEYLMFFYDNKKYKINNKLLIENIKVGSYKLFYDKEYVVKIEDNKTTILEINLLNDRKKDDDSKEGEKRAENDDNQKEKDDELKEEKEINDNQKEQNDNSRGENKENSNEDCANVDNEKITNDGLINMDKSEKLPETYDYLKRYCVLYEIFLIAGMIIKLYAKKNK